MKQLCFQHATYSNIYLRKIILKNAFPHNNNYSQKSEIKASLHVQYCFRLYILSPHQCFNVKELEDKTLINLTLLFVHVSDIKCL